MFPFPAALLMAYAASGGGTPTGTPPTYVGGTSAAVTSSSNTTISLTALTGGSDSAPAANDLVLVFFNRAAATGQVRAAAVITSGYDNFANVTNTSSGAVNLGLFKKFMGATPDTSVVVGPQAGSFENGAVVVHVWRGVNQTTPLDVTTTSASGNPAVPDGPSITPTTTGAVILVVGAAAISNSSLSAITQSGSELSNFISLVSTRVSASGAAAVGSHSGTGGTAFDPAAFTGGNGSSGCWGAATLALRPADA